MTCASEAWLYHIGISISDEPPPEYQSWVGAHAIFLPDADKRPCGVEDYFVGCTSFKMVIDRAQEVKNGIRRRQARLPVIVNKERAIAEARQKAGIDGKSKDEMPTVLAVAFTGGGSVPGTWFPDMVEMAGGRPLGTQTHVRPRLISPEEARALRPDVLLLLVPPAFGYGEDGTTEWDHRAYSEGHARTRALPADLFAEPGPWLYDGILRLIPLLHPVPSRRQRHRPPGEMPPRGSVG